MGVVLKREPDLWFYVPDYPHVRSLLEKLYDLCGVVEWAAEAGRVGGHPDDADVHVRGSHMQLQDFEAHLRVTKIEGLQIRGKEVT